MTALTKAGFDYGALDPEVAGEARAAADRIRTLGRQQNEAIIAIGKQLTTMKGKLGHGNFGAWIKAEFELSADTAERYMQVARTFGDQIPHGLRNLSLTALYALAAPSTPEPVRRELVSRIERGHRPTAAAIRQNTGNRKKSLTLPPKGNPATLGARIEAANEISQAGRTANVDPKPYIDRAIADIEAAKEPRATPDDGLPPPTNRSIDIDRDVTAIAGDLVEELGVERAIVLADAIRTCAAVH